MAQAAHCREGDAGYNVFLEGTMGDTPRSQTISTKNQGIASQVARDSRQGSILRSSDTPPILVGESSLIRIEALAKRDHLWCSHRWPTGSTCPYWAGRLKNCAKINPPVWTR